MATDDTTPLPPQELLEERLQELRELVFRAQGICGLAKNAGKQISETEDRGDHGRLATDIWCGLEAAHALLEEAAGQLSPGWLLRPRTHLEEMEQEHRRREQEVLREAETAEAQS